MYNILLLSIKFSSNIDRLTYVNVILASPDGQVSENGWNYLENVVI